MRRALSCHLQPDLALPHTGGGLPSACRLAGVRACACASCAVPGAPCLRYRRQRDVDVGRREAVDVVAQVELCGLCLHVGAPLGLDLPAAAGSQLDVQKTRYCRFAATSLARQVRNGAHGSSADGAAHGASLQGVVCAARVAVWACLGQARAESRGREQGDPLVGVGAPDAQGRLLPHPIRIDLISCRPGRREGQTGVLGRRVK